MDQKGSSVSTRSMHASKLNTSKAILFLKAKPRAQTNRSDWISNKTQLNSFHKQPKSPPDPATKRHPDEKSERK
jgi:hypothetical protein